MSDGELRDTVGDLLVHVRTPHVVPSSHDTLTSAVRRGLISAPPPHLLADEPCGRSPASSWLRGKNNGLFVKPRFFQPFHDEVKVKKFTRNSLKHCERDMKLIGICFFNDVILQ